MKRLFAVTAVCFVLAGSILAQSTVFVGTWKLNLEKSKYPAGMAPKSLTRTITADGDNVTYKFEGEGPDGSALSYGWTCKYDGSDAEVTGTGAPMGMDQISIKQLNSHMLSATLKKGGKTIGTSTATVSHDGKTLTLNTKGTDANGKPMRVTQVYDKQ